MRKKTLICCFILLSALRVTLAQKPVQAPVAQTSRQLRAEEATFHSQSLDRDMHYLMLLPHDYSDGHRFPVLYLLHGLYGDYKNWDTRTGLERYAQTMPFIIVMPDADNSWYTNSATVPRDKFEDYIAKDLISEIDAKYRTIPERRARAIAGLSMGGYGAIKLSLQHTELFVFAGSLSGAFNAAQNLDELRPEFRAKLLQVFGDARSQTRTQNDVFLLLKNVPTDPYFYLSCGSGDFFLETNRALAAQLSSQKLLYEYHETPGGHAWDFWDSALGPMLNSIARHFDPSSAPVRK